MKRFGLFAVLLLAFSALASAGIIPCDPNALGMDVTTIGTGILPSPPDGCWLGNMQFDTFVVGSAPPGGVIFLSPVGTGVSGNEVNLGFQLTTPAPPADLTLLYHVSTTDGSLINGVDNGHNGLDTRIQEVVCAVPFMNNVTCPAGSELANFVNNGGEAVASFDGVSQVWILKDIQLRSDDSFISAFINSHQVVPEPLTSVLFGTGLLLAGAVRRLRSR